MVAPAVFGCIQCLICRVQQIALGTMFVMAHRDPHANGDGDLVAVRLRKWMRGDCSPDSLANLERVGQCRTRQHHHEFFAALARRTHASTCR